MPRPHMMVAAALWVLPSMALAQAPFPVWEKPKPWIAPARMFSVEVPWGWEVFFNDKDPSTIEFRASHFGEDVSLFVRLIRVPRGALPRQILLKGLEERLRKLPSFKEGPRRDVKVSDLPGAEVAGVYYHQGNAQFPRAVEEIVVVKDTEAFVFHFECFQPLAAQVRPDLEVLYRSFVIRPKGSGGEGAPLDSTRKDGLIDTDHIPF